MNSDRSNEHRATLRETIQFYLIDCKTLPGRLIDISIILINLIVCLLFVVDTYPISAATRVWLWRIDVITVVFFTVEYAARLYGSRNRLRYVFTVYAIIDLAAILPTLALLFISAAPQNIGIIKIIRIIRVFRIFRFLRFTADPHFFFGDISLHLLKVVRLVLTIFLIFFVSAGLFWFVESPANPTVRTFGDAFYFTVVALTTVGFGDIIPVSEAGRWVTVLMILSGIVLIPWQAGQIIREWVRYRDKTDVVCPNCGMRFHDNDASHCKSCGHILHQNEDS